MHEVTQDMSVNLHQNNSEKSNQSRKVENKENKEQAIGISSSSSNDTTSSLYSITSSTPNGSFSAHSLRARKQGECQGLILNNYDLVVVFHLGMEMTRCCIVYL